MKILRTIVLIFAGIISVLIVISIIGLYIPHLNKDDLKKLIYEKTGFLLKKDFKIQKCNNTGLAPLHSDFAEEYYLHLNEIDHKMILDSLKSNSPIGWEKIEKGYDLVLNSKNFGDTLFIFTVLKNQNEISVQIIED